MCLLQLLRRQSISRLVLTPHLDLHNSPVTSLLTRLPDAILLFERPFKMGARIASLLCLQTNVLRVGDEGQTLFPQAALTEPPCTSPFLSLGLQRH